LRRAAAVALAAVTLVTAPATAAAAHAPAKGTAAGFSGKAAHIYDLYYEHCSHYTWKALAWPQRAGNATQAARMFAGPPRTYQPPAFRGCLAGLGAGRATITVAKLVALAAADDDH